MRWNCGFTMQLASMVNAFLKWSKECGFSGSSIGTPLSQDAVIQETRSVQVVDLFETYKLDVPLLQGTETIAAALVEQGLIPSAPYQPTVAFSTRTMELYRTTNLRCPHLAIQSFVKSLCDLHGVPFLHCLSKQFSIAYDVYLSICKETEQHVQVALKCDVLQWRLHHACPACTYKLEGEKKMIFEMLVTMDGNDSLKHIIQCGLASEDENRELIAGESKELSNDQEVHGDYYLSREKVNQWAKGVLEEMLPTGQDSAEGTEGEESNLCTEQWKNMIDDLTAWMWGIFDETGIFLALCRHSFVLLIVDMIQSGELAKYPLAVVKELLGAFGTRIGGGYDIGCKFGTTLVNSPLGPLTRELEYKALVGSFHGHAHN
ncbi:hypothetical protein C0992_003482 [Termitomyces sp. T32_za158]|nr:hypothetical protein C0992_003482 [Termitomyces sp. T32_za158]